MELMGHRHEIVLAADTGDDTTVVKTIGDHPTAQRDHDAGVHEAGMRAVGLGPWDYREIPVGGRPYLERMKLGNPKNLQDKVVRMLLVEELKKAGAI